MPSKPSDASEAAAKPGIEVPSRGAVVDEAQGVTAVAAVELQPEQMPDPRRKGILVDVLRPAHGGDNTNFGVSSTHITFVLIGEEVAGETEPTPNAPPLVLIRRDNRPDTLHAEPPGGAPAFCVGYMFGGNFVWSADALFPSAYPIPVHDRVETHAQHEMLSQGER